MEKEKIAAIIAKNIQHLMNQHSLSSSELARKSKISTGTVSKILHGSMSISVPMAITIAEGLEIPITELLKGLIQEESNIDARPLDSKQTNEHFIGIMSINNRRFTCIKNQEGLVMGRSEIEGVLDLTETSGNLYSSIKESIKEALLEDQQINLKNTRLNLVTQSYEFEDTRQKFKIFMEKYFKEVTLLPDWQLTYWAAFGKEEGISLVVDKGVSLSYMYTGSLKKLGGWKFPVYDLGGENWLGVETIRHTIEAFEGYIPMSDLAQNVLAKFNGKLESIIETCFKGAKDPDVYCLFADVLLRAYFIGLPEAKDIVKKGFQMVYRSVERADNILKKEVKISLNGALTDIYRNFFNPNRLITPPSNKDKIDLLTDISKEFLHKHGVV